ILTDLPDVAFRLGIDLASMSPLCQCGAFAFLVDEAELPGVVSIAIMSSYLKHGAGPTFEDRHRHHSPVILVDLGHAHLAPQKSHTHRHTPSKVRTISSYSSGTSVTGSPATIANLEWKGEISTPVAARRYGELGVGAVARWP